MTTREKRISPYEQLRRLQTVTDAALAHVSVDELLDSLLDRVREALEADTSAVLMLDDQRAELVARAAKGLEEEVERGVTIPVGKGFAGRVAAERRPVIIPDVDHSEVLNPILREKGIRSLLGVPLLARGRVLGVLHVGTLRSHDFSEDEVELLQLVADRVALAIDRSLVHEELFKLDALKRDFIATAAHEVRTPASIIFGVARTLKERGATLDDDTQATLLNAFYDASERLARLTDDLLDFARLDANLAEFAFEPVAIRELVANATHGLSMRPAEEIEVSVPEELVVLSDRRALELIVANLVRNGLVHGTPPVSISAGKQDGITRIQVEDRGPGVAEPFVGRLFEPFARADEAEARPGVGLGLAIAQSYARQLGGQLVYEPGRPRGASFTLVLPERRAQD